MSVGPARSITDSGSHPKAAAIAMRLCLVAGLLLAGHAQAEDCHLDNYGTLPVQVIGGRATTMVKINGQDTRFIIDTGAFFNMMSNSTASALGLKLAPAPYGFRISGVGGATDVQQTHVKEFGILDAKLDNVAFIVGGTDTGDGLLGANLLDIADLEIDLAHGKLTLFKAKHCEKTPLAYWAKGTSYQTANIESTYDRFDRRTFLDVTINGKKVRALLDSGAPATLLTRDAAKRVGIDVKAAGSKSTGAIHGVGAKSVNSWVVDIDKFTVGTEMIQHSQMQVMDGTMGDRTDLLLGLDFLLAHHMFISNSTKQAFLTYNGGRVFSLAVAPEDSDNAADGHGAKEGGAAPKTASEYALQGQAQLARGELNAALANIDEAIRLAPDEPAYYIARARVHQDNKQPEPALADLDKALGLQPKNVDALLMRAHLRLAQDDRTGAASDLSVASATVPAGSLQTRWIASLYIALDQPASALPLLDDWIRLHQDDAMLGEALNERCWARGLSNQMLADGLKDCRKAIRRDGANPAYLDSLGLVQLRLGDYQDAIKSYQQALAGKSDMAWTRYGLGLAKIHGGQTEAGNADLKAARALDPKIEGRASKYGLTASVP